jgi:hypothetical protein
MGWRDKLLWNTNIGPERGDKVKIIGLYGESSYGVVVSKIREDLYKISIPATSTIYTFSKDSLEVIGKCDRFRLIDGPLNYINRTFEIGERGFISYQYGNTCEVYFDGDDQDRILSRDNIEITYHE